MFALWLDTYAVPAETFEVQRLRLDDEALPFLGCFSLHNWLHRANRTPASLQVPVLVTNADMRPKLSPRLLEAALWAFARWLDTYVLPAEPFESQRSRPDDVSLPALPDTNDVLRTALEASAACMTTYPGEYALHSVAVRHVLRILVSHPARIAAVTQQVRCSPTQRRGIQKLECDFSQYF